MFWGVVGWQREVWVGERRKHWFKKVEPERLLSAICISLETGFPRGHAWPLRSTDFVLSESPTGELTVTGLIHVPFQMRKVESWFGLPESSHSFVTSWRWNLPSTTITPIFIPCIPAGPLLREKGGTLDGISSLALLDALRSWRIISSQLLFQSYGEINTDMFSFVWALGKCLFSSSDGPPLYLHNGKKTTLPPSGSSECDLQSSSS